MHNCGICFANVFKLSPLAIPSVILHSAFCISGICPINWNLTGRAVKVCLFCNRPFYIYTFVQSEQFLALFFYALKAIYPNSMLENSLSRCYNKATNNIDCFSFSFSYLSLFMGTPVAIGHRYRGFLVF